MQDSEQFLEPTFSVTIEDLDEDFCEIWEKYWLDVEKFGFSTKKRKNAIKTPSMRSLKFRV